MPRVSKVRIVNFSYNDGNRLITDELFDFGSSDQQKALNVLINLENGGGKSVLVQLMMQPIIPKAKVANRNISSFFTKPNDHCFVILEWIKDNSTEKLMTGIAMASSESHINEDDPARGRAIKYYTFYSNYGSEDSPYSIVNLPLSRKDQGRFIPADFDDVRKFAKNSKGMLHYYASEDNRQWQRKLEEYGLSRDEWKMIEELNTVEGGLETYFSTYKTSDQLINGLLIPTIERKLHSSQTTGDVSLSTMLISYARQYAGHEEILKEKSTYERFQHELEELKPMAETLWTCDDQMNQMIGRIFGFSDALRKKASDLTVAQQGEKTLQERLKQQEYHVRWEKASLDYYQTQDRFLAAEKAKRLAGENVRQKQNEYAEADRQVKALQCANFLQRLTKAEGQAAGIRDAIKEREAGSQGCEELKNLKYSAACEIKEELNRNKPKLHAYKEQISELEARIDRQNDTEKQAKLRCRETKSDYDHLEGQFSAYKQETDNQMEATKVQLIRRLDGFYAVDEVVQFEAETQKASIKVGTDIEKAEGKLKRIAEQLDELPQKNTELSIKLHENEGKVNKIKADIQIHSDLEKQILNLCDQYNLDPNRRFTGELTEYLKKEQGDHEVRYTDTLRQIEISKEAVRAAERGSLHVPHAVIEYLNATGVQYTTCEKYLLDAVERQTLKEERCMEILQNCPAVAYGVVMDEESSREFFAFGREKWLPSMVPLFSHAEIDRMLKGEALRHNAIAFYSEDYFLDRQNYLSHLKREEADLIQKKNRLAEHKKLYEKQIQMAEQFSYPQDWLEKHHSMMLNHEKACEELQQKIQDIDEKREMLKDQRNQAGLQIEQLKQCKLKIERTLNDISKILQRLKEEETLQGLLHQKKMDAEAAEVDYRDASKKLEQMLQEKNTLNHGITQLGALVRELEDAYGEVSDAIQGTRVNGTWQNLYEHFRERQKAEDQAIADLADRLRQINTQISEYQDEIKNRDIPEEDYLGLSYSKEQERELTAFLKILSNDIEETRNCEKKTIEEYGAAENSFVLMKNRIEVFGGNPLEKAEVGDNFDHRLQELKSAEAESVQKQQMYDREQRKVERTQDRIDDSLRQYGRPEIIPSVELSDDYQGQCEDMKNQLTEGHRRLKHAQKAVEDVLMQLSNSFAESKSGLKEAITGMTTLIQDAFSGDRYYTLVNHIEGYLDSARLAIGKIETDLMDFEKQRADLIHHCVVQGQRVYKGLIQLQSSSRVQVHEGMAKKQMLRFDMPETVEPAVAEKAIAEEIEQGVREIISDIKDPDSTEATYKKRAERIVGSSSLLRKYIGKTTIQVEAYKIDQNAHNSRYRTWENTQINNSGAEKFVVYFAVILALINYTRGTLNGIQDRELHSALILDNPFGSTTSKHILNPMFAIARHFRVQLICLSHITQVDVLNCFDIVIKAIIKKHAMSSREFLTHEGNEKIEHGFYRAEQMSLL